MRRRGRYELLSDARLQALVDGDGVVPLLIGGPDTRLSLAGANPRYQHLPVNEAFVMGLAARVVHGIVDEVVDRCLAELPAWQREFRERHGEQPILQRLPGEIAHRGKRLRRAVG